MTDSTMSPKILGAASLLRPKVADVAHWNADVLAVWAAAYIQAMTIASARAKTARGPWITSFHLSGCIR